MSYVELNAAHFGVSLISSKKSFMLGASAGFAAGVRSSLPWIDRTCLHETKRIVPSILGIEGAFAPRLHADLAAVRSMHVLLRQALQRLGSLKDRIEVVHDKVQSLRGRVRRANGRNIDDLQYGDVPRVTPHNPSGGPAFSFLTRTVIGLALQPICDTRAASLACLDIP